MADTVTERFHPLLLSQSIGHEADESAADVPAAFGVHPIRGARARAGGRSKEATKGRTTTKSGSSKAADVLRSSSTQDKNRGQKGRADDNGKSRAESGGGVSTAKADGRGRRPRASAVDILAAAVKAGTARQDSREDKCIGAGQTPPSQGTEVKSKDTRQHVSGNSSHLFSRKRSRAGIMETSSPTVEPDEMAKSIEAMPKQTPKHRREEDQTPDTDSRSSHGAPGRNGNAAPLGGFGRLFNGNGRATEAGSERSRPSDIPEASVAISDGEARRKTRRRTRRTISLNEKKLSFSHSDPDGDQSDPAVSSLKASSTDSPTQPQECTRKSLSRVSPVEVVKKLSRSMFRGSSRTGEHGGGNEEASDDRTVNVGAEHEKNRGNEHRSGVSKSRIAGVRPGWPPLTFVHDKDDGDASMTRRDTILNSRNSWKGFVGPRSFRNQPNHMAAATNNDHHADEALRVSTVGTGDERGVAHVDQNSHVPVASDVPYPVTNAAAAVDLVKKGVSRLVSSERRSMTEEHSAVTIDVMETRAAVEDGVTTGGDNLFASRGGKGSRTGDSWSDNEACFFGLGG